MKPQRHRVHRETHNAIFGLSLCLCVSVVIGIFSAQAHAEVSVLDDLGNTVRLAQPAKRIVSLAPHMTETLFAAGAGARASARPGAHGRRLWRAWTRF